MDTGFKTIDGAWTGRGSAGTARCTDWPGLHARLAAAHAARRALLAACQDAGPARASFAPAAAEMLAGLDEGLAAVNRNDLGDGKPPRGNEGKSPALLTADDRGTA